MASYGFNTQPPEGGWLLPTVITTFFGGFNTQPPEGGWPKCWNTSACRLEFQHTAARRRLEMCLCYQIVCLCFNTQPPEGGWARLPESLSYIRGFNTQPPEGGWFQLKRLFTCQ